MAVPKTPAAAHRGECAFNGPLVRELTPAPRPEEVFRRMASRPHCLFLDSVMRHPTLGRYSFVAADPFEILQCSADGGDSLAILEQRLHGFSTRRAPELPPFQGGAAGWLGYDLGRSLEHLPVPKRDDFSMPALVFGLYDVVVAFDHATGRSWIVSQGFPEIEPARRRRRAAARLEETEEWLAVRDVCAVEPHCPERAGVAATPSSNFSRDEYLQIVRRAVEYIRAGDIFQVNLAQRLLTPAVDDSVALYHRLRRCNPATFAGYFDGGEFQIVSASPERFLQVLDGRVEARPIKGTRPRVGDPARDAAARAELSESEKDRAENIMIVDLLRNDLSRVCTADSVHVEQLCAIETYEHVFHLVSSVTGRLRPGRSPIDLLRASFPCGSITGAPKVRAMEIIAELEPDARGAYCGSMGYLGFDGSMDMNILIRTIIAGRGCWQFSVGGGIVAQSMPDDEYEETWHKAAGLLEAIGGGSANSPRGAPGRR